MSASQDTKSKTVARAVSDPWFRAALLRDPRNTLSDELGGVPEGNHSRGRRETPQHLYIVLPPEVSVVAELSDDQLAAAAGGSGPDKHKHHHTGAWNPLVPRDC